MGTCMRPENLAATINLHLKVLKDRIAILPGPRP